jgi:hypothetical protein
MEVFVFDTAYPTRQGPLSEKNSAKGCFSRPRKTQNIHPEFETLTESWFKQLCICNEHKLTEVTQHKIAHLTKNKICTSLLQEETTTKGPELVTERQSCVYFLRHRPTVLFKS